MLPLDAKTPGLARNSHKSMSKSPSFKAMSSKAKSSSKRLEQLDDEDVRQDDDKRILHIKKFKQTNLLRLMAQVFFGSALFFPWIIYNLVKVYDISNSYGSVQTLTEIFCNISISSQKLLTYHYEVLNLNSGFATDSRSV